MTPIRSVSYSGNGLKDRLASHLSRRVPWVVGASVVVFVLFLSTMQTDVNGSAHAYATDVGEIQNALPRWGLIHRSGYPLYTATGSLFVTLLRLVGIQPAASVSLFSAIWGTVAIGLLVILAQDLGVSGPAAALGALAAGLSTSVWAFASLAEVHTLTLVFSIATLIFALRFGRDGRKGDLLLLSLFFSQGAMHQRSVILLAPAVALLTCSQWRAFWQGLGPTIGIALLAPLTYLYMPFRVWTGATWVFGSPGTWDGFWEMLFDNRAERVFTWHASALEWQSRLEVLAETLSEDMPWPLLVIGLLSLALLAFAKGRGRESLALTLTWVPNALLTLVIWRGRVIDAQLAAKLPIAVMAGLGLAVLLHQIRQWSRYLWSATALCLTIVLVAWAWRVIPFLLSITRDPSSTVIIATAERIPTSPDARPTALIAPWGQDYWALAYAQAYQRGLSQLDIVDHNADLRGIVESGNRILMLSKTLHVLPISWWEKRMGPLYLVSAAPGVVEVGPAPPLSAAAVPNTLSFDLENGLSIRSTALEWSAQDQLLLTIYWEALQSVEQDYSVAVHLVGRDPPGSEESILSQADSLHPVDGWYPTSRWNPGEIVRDSYLIAVPGGSTPAAVRIAMYRADPDGGFRNTPWLSLTVP